MQIFFLKFLKFKSQAVVEFSASQCLGLFLDSSRLATKKSILMQSSKEREAFEELKYTRLFLYAATLLARVVCTENTHELRERRPASWTASAARSRQRTPPPCTERSWDWWWPSATASAPGWTPTRTGTPAAARRRPWSTRTLRLNSCSSCPALRKQELLRKNTKIYCYKFLLADN